MIWQVPTAYEVLALLGFSMSIHYVYFAMMMMVLLGITIVSILTLGRVMTFKQRLAVAKVAGGVFCSTTGLHVFSMILTALHPDVKPENVSQIILDCFPLFWFSV